MRPEQYLQRTNGERLLFLEGLKEAKDFLTNKIGFNPDSLTSFDRDKKYDQPVTVFIDTDEQEECLRFSIGYTHCICSPTNPYYNAIMAQKDALQILWRNDCISSGTVHYLLDMNYLPDLLKEIIFCKRDSMETRKNDARFLLRYMRQSKY